MKKLFITLFFLTPFVSFADTPYYLFATSSYNTVSTSSIYYTKPISQFHYSSSTTMTYSSALDLCSNDTYDGGGWELMKPLYLGNILATSTDTDYYNQYGLASSTISLTDSYGNTLTSVTGYWLNHVLAPGFETFTINLDSTQYYWRIAVGAGGTASTTGKLAICARTVDKNILVENATIASSSNFVTLSETDMASTTLAIQATQYGIIYGIATFLFLGAFYIIIKILRK